MGINREEKAFHARMRKVVLDVGFADITAAGMSKTLDFAAALPADAVPVSADVNVSVAFTDGAAGTVKVDLGFSGATTTLIAGGANNAGSIQRVGNGASDGCPQFAGSKTPRTTWTGSVNLNTLTAGQCRITVYYFLGDKIPLEERN